MAPRGRPRGIAWQQVTRLAETGVAMSDIVLALDLPAVAVEKNKTRLELAVAKGHAMHRVAVAKRLQREGIFKGRAHSLLGLARLRLGLDSRRPGPDAGLEALMEMEGAKERFLALLDKFIRNREAIS